MNPAYNVHRFYWFFACFFLLPVCSVQAQTEVDGIMMSKKVFCGGLMYSHSTWDDYWEGTTKRNNLNLRTVSNTTVAAMGAYGISKKVNLLFQLPYSSTHASAGTLRGMRGVQDLSLSVKYRPYHEKIGPGTLSVFGVASGSLPASNYVADYLPLSIGMGSKNLALRAMVDYQVANWFATLSGAYVMRSNIEIDREAYYTTQLHNTNVVAMPNASQFNVRAGYRNNNVVAEAVLNQWTTHGGFDITKNNMPFPSNTMNTTSAGINLKYETTLLHGLTFVGGGNHVLAGRNAGQASTVYGGLLYIINFSGNKKTPTTTTNNSN